MAVGISSYIDDVIVNEDIVTAEEVAALMRSYGLDSKPVEPLDNAWVLGLRVSRENGVIRWRRDNVIDSLDKVTTKRQVFSWCGQVLGHFPVTGHLRTACSYLKRMTNDTN